MCPHVHRLVRGPTNVEHSGHFLPTFLLRVPGSLCAWSELTEAADSTSARMYCFAHSKIAFLRIDSHSCRTFSVRLRVSMPWMANLTIDDEVLRICVSLSTIRLSWC